MTNVKAKKLALGLHPTPVDMCKLRKKLLLVAFRTVGFDRQAKGLLAVVAGRAILRLAVIFFGKFHFLLRLEDLRMAVRALRFMRVYMRFMAEKDRSFGLAFIFNIPSAHFLLSEGHAQGRKADNADADYQNSPEPIAHFFTSLPEMVSFFSVAEFTGTGELYVKKSLFSRERFVPFFTRPLLPLTKGMAFLYTLRYRE
jgi:hypothetical protein